MHMVRNIVMLLGLLVAFLPYLGFPYEVDKWIWTFAGFAIVTILFFSKRSRTRREVHQHTEQSEESEGGKPRALHIERTEVEDRPRMHLERKTIVDTERRHEDDNTDTLVEKKMTVVRRRRQKSEASTEENLKESTPQTEQGQ